ncbi:DUF1345 domain-containing protein [Paracoccaceae bacterium Fryx2]|nr:DUF1345 domain-containing protein [Paracoccaceae bacterium Fryx2]
MLRKLPHPRFVLFFAVLAAGTAASAHLTGVEVAFVAGFDAAALAFILSCLPLWRQDRLDAILRRTARDDGGRVLLLVVAAVVLVTVLLALGRMIGARATPGPADFALVTGTLVLAWLFVNLVYAFHYAHLYYDQGDAGDTRGLAFPGKDTPLFADFCYFSFVIGMTCQVSDVTIQTTTLRRVAMLHGLFAFFFNLGVLALTINVLSGVL